MRKQGREERHPMVLYPQATKVEDLPFVPRTAKSVLKNFWLIHNQKGLWKFKAMRSPNTEDIPRGMTLAWFYNRYQKKSNDVQYAVFYRDKGLEDALRSLLK